MDNGNKRLDTGLSVFLTQCLIGKDPENIKKLTNALKKGKNEDLCNVYTMMLQLKNQIPVNYETLFSVFSKHKQNTAHLSWVFVLIEFFQHLSRTKCQMF